jgi:hypothetical protein
MRRLITLLVAASSAVLISSSAWAAADHPPKASSCRASGAAASCTVTRTVHHPNVIRVHATARPNQTVSVTWSMTCTKGKDIDTTSGSFTARTPVSHRLRPSDRHSGSCAVSATVQLAKSGHLHAWLTAQN